MHRSRNRKTAESDQMILVGEHHDLHTVAGVDFRQNMRHMRLHRRQTDEQLVRDFLIRQPRAISISTSRSRSVSSSSSGSVYAGWAGAAVRPAPVVILSIRRLVADGAMIALPRYTVRIELSSVSVSVYLNRNPEAPALIAAITYSSKSNVVTIITLVRATSDFVPSAANRCCNALICRVYSTIARRGTDLVGIHRQCGEKNRIGLSLRRMVCSSTIDESMA